MKKLAWIMALCLLTAGCGVKKPLKLPDHDKNKAAAESAAKPAAPQPQPVTQQPDADAQQK